MAIDPKKPPVCDPDEVVPARDPGTKKPPGGDPAPKTPPRKDPQVPGAPPPEEPPKRM